MFTGIITGVGRISDVKPLGDAASHGNRLHVDAPAHYLDDVGPGDSIAINGACMTVTSLDAARSVFTVDVVTPTRAVNIRALWVRMPLEMSPRRTQTRGAPDGGDAC